MSVWFRDWMLCALRPSVKISSRPGVNVEAFLQVPIASRRVGRSDAARKSELSGIAMLREPQPPRQLVLKILLGACRNVCERCQIFQIAPRQCRQKFQHEIGWRMRVRDYSGAHRRAVRPSWVMANGRNCLAIERPP